MRGLQRLSFRPYFARFLTTSEKARGLAVLQTRRLGAMTDAEAGAFEPDDVAEIGQFLGTLLTLQGREGITSEETQAAVARVKKWQRNVSLAFAQETMERCIVGLGAGGGYDPIYSRDRITKEFLPLL